MNWVDVCNEIFYIEHRASKVGIVREISEYTDQLGQKRHEVQFFQMPEKSVKVMEKKSEEISSPLEKRKTDDSLDQPRKKRKMEPIGPRGVRELAPSYEKVVPVYGNGLPMVYWDRQSNSYKPYHHPT